jgi:hypothetical protein
VTREQVFQAWAPDGARWSPWAKPVVFAHLPEGPAFPNEAAGVVPFAPDLSALPPADGAAAVVVDLPDAQGALFGLQLAQAGYRPVPLYNAVPGPSYGDMMMGGTVSLVDLKDVVAALRVGAEQLWQTQLPWDAPPAFLLDARRRTGSGVAPRPGMFDNRSVSLPTDFPSANFLLAAGVRRAVLVQHVTGDPQPQADLAHTLRRWQEAGVELLAFNPAVPGGLTPLSVSKPRWYGFVWHALLSRMGLRRHALGGYGGVIPEPSSHGAAG